MEGCQWAQHECIKRWLSVSGQEQVLDWPNKPNKQDKLGRKWNPLEGKSPFADPYYSLFAMYKTHVSPQTKKWFRGAAHNLWDLWQLIIPRSEVPRYQGTFNPRFNIKHCNAMSLLWLWDRDAGHTLRTRTSWLPAVVESSCTVVAR